MSDTVATWPSGCRVFRNTVEPSRCSGVSTTSINSGVVHKNVDASELLDGGFDGHCLSLKFGNVTAD
jgi:hypothetical protein